MTDDQTSSEDSSKDKNIHLSTDELKDLFGHFLSKALDSAQTADKSALPGAAPQAQAQAVQAVPAQAQQPVAPNPQQFGAPNAQGQYPAANTQLGMLGADATLTESDTANNVSSPANPVNPQAGAQGNVPSGIGQAKTADGQLLPTLQATPQGSQVDRLAAIGGAQKGEALQNETDAKLAQASAQEDLQKIINSVTLPAKESAVKIAQQYKDDTQKVAQDFEADIAGELDKYHQSVKDLQASGDQPWTDRGTAWTIGTAIFAGINQLGMGIAGNNGPNQVLQMIQKAQDTDLKKQQLMLESKQRNVEAQGTLLNKMMEVYKNKDVAFAAARAASTDLVAAQFDQAMAKTAPQQLAATSAGVRAGILAQQQKDQAALTDKIVEHGFEAKRIDLQQANQRAEQEIRKAQLGNKQGKGLFAELPPADQKLAESAYNAINDSLVPGLTKLTEALNAPATERLGSPVKTYEKITEAKALIKKGIEEASKNGRASKIASELNAAEAGLDSFPISDLLRGGDAAKKAQDGVGAIINKLNGQLRQVTGKDFTQWKQEEQQRAE